VSSDGSGRTATKAFESTEDGRQWQQCRRARRSAGKLRTAQHAPGERRQLADRAKGDHTVMQPLSQRRKRAAAETGGRRTETCAERHFRSSVPECEGTDGAHLILLGCARRRHPPADGAVWDGYFITRRWLMPAHVRSAPSGATRILKAAHATTLDLRRQNKTALRRDESERFEPRSEMTETDGARTQPTKPI
jgi:hypothetical protein